MKLKAHKVRSMNEQRQTAYLNLIQELLSCASFEEPAILDAHTDLIDAGLVQAMEQVAAMMRQRGNQNAADFLRNLAAQIAEPINQKRQTAYLNLIDALLKCPPGQESAILEIHRELVDAGLIQTMQEMTAMLAVQGEQDASELLRNIATGLAADMEQSSQVRATESPERREAYLNLIEELLGCPSGTESEILMTNRDLIDAGLVEMLKRVATVRGDRGDFKAAEWLRKVAGQLDSLLGKSPEPSL